MTSLIQKNDARNFDPVNTQPVPVALQALANERRAVMEMFLNAIRKPC